MKHNEEELHDNAARETAQPEAISLRDHFAAAAIAGLAKTGSTFRADPSWAPNLAKLAYELADAMLIARSRVKAASQQAA